jgi:hypothetical protein
VIFRGICQISSLYDSMGIEISSSRVKTMSIKHWSIFGSHFQTFLILYYSIHLQGGSMRYCTYVDVVRE